MEITAIYRCVAALDVHQAKLTVCMLFENAAGDVVTEIREFGAFKRDRRAMAAWVASFQSELVVIPKGTSGEYRDLLKELLCRAGIARLETGGGQCPSRQAGARTQDRYCRRAIAGHFSSLLMPRQSDCHSRLSTRLRRLAM